MRIVDSMVAFIVLEMVILVAFFVMAFVAIRRFQATKQLDDGTLARVEATIDPGDDTA